MNFIQKYKKSIEFFIILWAIVFFSVFEFAYLLAIGTIGWAVIPFVLGGSSFVSILAISAQNQKDKEEEDKKRQSGRTVWS